MKHCDIDQLKKCEIEKTVFAISNVISDYSALPNAVYAAAYVLLRASRDNNIVLDSLDSFVNSSKVTEERALFIESTLRRSWEDIKKLQNAFDTDSLEAVLLFYEPSGVKAESDATPVGISTLARRLLRIKPGDEIADFGTGRGSFLRECYIDEPNAHYYGNEINAYSKEIAAIRADLLGGDIEIEQGSILDMEKLGHRFTAAFSNYPFGMRTSAAFGKKSKLIEQMIYEPAFSKSVSMDWIFNRAIYNTIGGPGRVVCIMTNGSTWNSLDAGARKHFIANGIVEAVIALPERIFENTNIGTTMIILSHGHSTVKMVDARNMCHKGRRLNVITDEDVEKILNCVDQEGAFSKLVECSEIAENDYVLNPARYLDGPATFNNGIQFESLIKTISRGAQLTADQLDQMVSSTPTDVQYLMLSNIQDGIIEDDLPYLTGLEKKLDKYCIKNNMLIISKNGAPFKIAVAELSEKRKVLANGNLYIIELDESKVDPYYLKAFFDSDAGIAALKSIVVGAVIPSIGVEQLKKIMIPIVPLEEQHRIAEQYRVRITEVKLLRRKLDKALSGMKHVFDDAGEE